MPWNEEESSTNPGMAKTKAVSNLLHAIAVDLLSQREVARYTAPAFNVRIGVRIVAGRME